MFDPLTTIVIDGRLSAPVGGFPPNLVDMYGFTVFTPFLLSAETIGFIGDVPDPQLFLFDGTGMGLLWNNDRSLSPVDTQAALPLAMYGPGGYYLAISWFGVDPVDALGNYLFDSLGSNGGGPVNPNPVAGWLDTGAPGQWDDETYAIAFNLTAVPEPSTFGMGLAGAGLLLLWRRKKS
jgi:hypothetical protein